MAVRVVIDPAKLAEFVRSPQGPVFRHMVEQTELVKEEAKREVGVYQPPDPYSAAHRKRRPGTLRDSIVKRIVAGGRWGFRILVGSDDEIALIHHEGTEPHTITARRAPLLVFFWPKRGHVVSMKSVRHPGTDPNRYLVKALRVLGRR